MDDIGRVSPCHVMLICAGALAILPGCRTSPPSTYYRATRLHYGLSARDYLLHVPQNYDKRKAWPLVLVLHGAFSTAKAMEAGSGYSALADREGFVVAYPNGIGLFGFLQHWNAGHCCGLAEMDHVDDSEFLRCVIRDVSNELHIDQQRIYVVGHSNGAMLAYRFASENCESIAGVGIVAGSIGSSKGRKGATRRIGPPELPVPLIAVHGREDRSVPFKGGPGLRSGGRRYVSVVESVRLWARYCGCASVPEVRDDPQGGQRIMAWRDDAGGTWAVLHILDDWEHAWPGMRNIARLPQDHPLRTFEVSQVIWDFFCDHTQASSPKEVLALRTTEHGS